MLRLRPFLDAARGLLHLLKTERHARWHAFATLVISALGLWLQLDRHDWCWLVAAFAMVWSAEALNSALERLADRVTREHDPLIGQAKDLAAGAVLCVALGAVAIGFLVLGPPLWQRLGW